MESKKITGTIKITGTTKKPENWLPQKIKENPFQFFWSLGLTLGGAILIGFFFQIGFMPDMSFSEASGIFIAAISVGLIIVLPMLLAMVPAILIQTSDIAKDSYKNNSLFRYTTGLLIISTFFIVNCPSYRNYIYAVYFFLCLFISCSRAENKSCLEKIKLCWRKLNSAGENQTLLEKIKLCWGKISSPSQRQKIYFILIDTLAWSTFPVISSFLFYKYKGFEQNSVFPFIFWIILSSAFAWILIIFSDENDLRLWPTIFISYIAISLLLTGGITKIPSTIIQQLGLGERQVSVLLNKEGCDAFNAIPIPAGQNPLYYKRCHNNIVRSVHLRSRIASPYVFEVKGNGDQVWRIIIPKEQVISLIISDAYGSQPPNPGAPNNQTQDCPDRNQSPNPPQQGCASAAQNGAAAATK